MTVEPFKDSDLMPFGKHKDEKIGDVPANYLLWWFNEQNRIEPIHAGQEDSRWRLYRYIEKNFKHLENDVKNERGKR